MASQAGRTQHESAYDSPQPSQMSQHESTSDLPHSSQMSQHKSRHALYGRSRQGQPSEGQQAETHAQETQQHEPAVSQGHHSTDQCCSPVAENQQGFAGVSCIKEGFQQGQSRSTPQLAFQLQEATHHSSHTDAKRYADSMEAMQHGPCKQTPAEPHQAPEADYRPELVSLPHLQLNGQPTTHVQQALSQVFEACSDHHMGGSNWEGSRQEDEGNCAGGGSFRGVASPNAARLAFAR